MGKKDIRLVAFDMDGTVLADGAEITPRLTAVLDRLMKEGVLVVPCTGRGRRQLPRTLEELGLPYTITSNGARIKDERSRDTLRSFLVDWQMAADIFHDLEAYDGFACVHIDEVVYNQHPDEDYIRRKYHMPPYMEVALVHSAQQLVRERRRGVEKIFFRPAHEKEREKIRRRILDDYPVFSSSSSLHNLEFSVPGCTKGDSLRWLCGYLGIEAGQVIAFGDGENDKEMLSFAGMGMAMKGASPACIAAADQVIGSCAEDGVAACLEKLCF